MAAGKSNHETEIKLAISGAAEGRRALRQGGFHVSKPRVFERNTIFDAPGQKLRRSGRLLRVRRAGRAFTLTFKGRGNPGRLKSREELEIRLPDADTIECIFDRLGLHPVFQYEKYRTEFELARGRGTATLDETPIGCFLELEGAPAWIDRTARRLGFTGSDYITASYCALYLEWCRRGGVRPSNMVFAKRGR